MRTKEKLEFNRPLRNGGSIIAGTYTAAGVTPRVEHARIDKTLNFVASNRHRQFRVKDLIGKSRMSRRGFFKAISKHAGISPGKMMRNFQIEKVKKVLVEMDISLADIAERCGYRSVNSLSVAFRNAVGMAPKKFQRQAWLGRYHSKSRRKSPRDS